MLFKLIFLLQNISKPFWVNCSCFVANFFNLYWKNKWQMLLAWKKNNAHMTNMVEKKSSWEKLIFWVEVGKDVEVLLVNCFQSPTLKIHNKIVSLIHQIINFIPDFICCCTNLTWGSVKWASESLSRLNKFLVIVLISPVNASMHVVIHMSLQSLSFVSQSLSFVSLTKATCNVKLCNKLSSKLLDEMMKIAENILCFSVEP